MLKILLDFDGTVYDFNKEYFAYLNEKYKLCLDSQRISDYDFSVYFDKLGFNKSTACEFIKDMEEVPNFYKCISNFRKDTISNITELLTSKKGFNLAKDKVQIVIYTKILDNMFTKLAKINFIEKFKSMYPFYSEAEVILEENEDQFKDVSTFDIIIDDNPKLVRHYFKVKPSGTVILPIHKYNEWLLDSIWKNHIFGVK